MLALYFFAADSDVKQVGDQVTNIFQHITNTYFNPRAVIALIAFLAVALIAGRVIAAILRRVVVQVGKQADRTENLQMVNRLRRYETVIILSIAIIRTVIVIFALYSWWIFIHPNQQPKAIVGASALLAIVIGGALSPTLRDISSGSVMMAEQWYAVGDHVKIEPFGDMQGVVERVTLRATRIRGLNGEVIWVNNQSIAAVRITPRGIRTLAIELFVSDLDRAESLIQATNRRLPIGQLLVSSPLNVMTSTLVGEKMWHITAIAETAPGREWIIERHAIEVMKEIDGKHKDKIMMSEPVARFADTDAERRFARAIQNARKAPRKKRPLTKAVKSSRGTKKKSQS